MQITYALANVYDDSPDLEVRVTDEHRARAEEMMACVESGDVTRLRDAFLEVRGKCAGIHFAAGCDVEASSRRQLTKAYPAAAAAACSTGASSGLKLEVIQQQRCTSLSHRHWR